MSSVVCQGLQTCLEPCVSNHKISPTMSMISQPFEEKQDRDFSRHENNNNGYDDTYLKSNKNCNKGGWNFLEALINPSHSTEQVTDKNMEVYVHPLVKRSSSALSTKSLEICTESLGCETGNDTSSNKISSFSWEKEKMRVSSDEYSSLYKEKSMQLDDFSSPWSNKNRSNYRKFTKSNTSKCNFPPPLTSISRSDGVQVRPHREGGRLIINAVAVSSCRTYLEAERTNGRLRLSFLRECSHDCHCEMNKKSELADNEVDEECWDEDKEGSNTKSGLELGMGEFPSRCNEGQRGGKEMSNWGPLWLAIS